MRVYQIKIDFNVTSEIKRYVYVYLIEEKYCYLVDTGVNGCQEIICEKLKQIGRDISEIKGIFLTHVHPDHIGAAAWIKAQTGCKVFAGAGERRWIEDIDLQFKERPIPNFYNLAGQSVKVDVTVQDGDRIELEDGLSVEIVGTPGHSIDEISYKIGSSLFIGDTVPVAGDIPIYIDREKILGSMEKLEKMSDVKIFYPAWDKVYSYSELKDKIIIGKNIINMIDESVRKNIKIYGKENFHKLVIAVSNDLNMPALLSNPLFEKTVKCHVLSFF